MRRAAPLLAAVALAGCGGAAAEPAAERTPAAAGAAAETVAPAAATTAESSGTTSPYIGSLAVDPGDGTIIAGTGVGLYRVPAGGRRAVKFEGALTAPEGTGTVSGSLVVRFSGPGRLLGSGHPGGGGTLPENLGLIRSADAGRRWEPVSGMGEGDYHELEPARGLLVAVGADEPDIRLSRDGGRTWESRTPPAPPLDVAIDPGDPKTWAASTEQGVFISANEGRTWRPRDATPKLRLAWPAPDALVAVDAGGNVKLSKDAGRSWSARGSTRHGPSELVAAGGDLYAAVPGGRILRSRDRGASWRAIVTLG